MLQGMVQAAAYIFRKLRQENLLDRAFNWNLAEGTDKFPLVRRWNLVPSTCSTVVTLLN
jgi:hypothetical protein